MEIGLKMTENCELVSKWMMENRLKLNADKTHLLTVGTSRRLQSIEAKVNVVMDGFTLEESSDKVETLLGCQIEPGLKWHKQIDALLVKLRNRLTALAHLRNILPFHLRKTITEGMFVSCPIVYLCSGVVTRRSSRPSKSCRTRLLDLSPTSHSEHPGRRFLPHLAGSQ
jgi:hypothetical protein